MTTISIAKQFSETPGGRTDADGPNNGRKFRIRFLERVLRDEEPVNIDLDGVAGLPGSFCDEAFGQLVRQHHLTRERFYNLFHFTGRGPDFAVNKGMIELNVDRALREHSKAS